MYLVSQALREEYEEVSRPNLPTVYEVAAGPEDNLVLEEFIQGDTMGFGTLFTPGRPGGSSARSARACGCSTPWERSTGT